MHRTEGPSGPAAEDSTDAADAALRAEVEAELQEQSRSRRRAGESLTGGVLLIGGAVGWIAALMLLIDKLFLLENPGGTLACDVNPFISCGNLMMTWQASAFGIPNMAIGLAGFAIMGASGALLLGRTRLPTWYGWALLGGMTFAFAFVHFLAISAIFVIRSLCPWCMVVWAVTAPMFFVVLARTVEEGVWRPPEPVAKILRHWVILTIAWYVWVVAMIFLAFLPQWMGMFGVY